ncbi:MAG: DNA internalization-related competence protein ComEC/Rec2 [bacterium]|nr:DNA internalization-related competence protein ComEC/Rec2 [bacterium]
MSTLFPFATLAYGVGLLLADAGWVGSFAAQRFGLASFALGWAAGRRMCWRSAAVLGVVGACGAFSLASLREQAEHDELREPRETVVEGTVCGRVEGFLSSAVDLCRATDAADPSMSVARKLRVYEGMASDGAFDRLQPGDRIRARLRITPLRPVANPGARDTYARLLRRGIGARASLRDPALLVRMSQRDVPAPAAWRSLRARFAGWRSRLGETLASYGAGGGLVRALVLGDRATLGSDTREAFSKLGITHLLAVSGLHVALVAGFVYTVARRLCLHVPRVAARGDPRRMALGFAFAGAVAYAVLAGWGIPVRRALLFLAVLCAAIAQGRPVHGVQLLCLAALPLLIVEPYALFELGGQLSFVASGALLLARSGTRGEVTGWRGLVRTSATAIVATAPLLAWHGGNVGLFGLAANLIAVPWIAVIYLPASLVAALLAALPDSALAHAVVGIITRVGELTLLAVTRVADSLPSIGTGAAPTAWVLCVATLIALGSLSLASTFRRVVLCVLAGALLSFGPVREIVPAPPRVVVLDVGQGDAIVVQGREAAVLVDGGRAMAEMFDAGRRIVVPALASLGISRLDVVVASHADLDHRGGLEAVVEAIPIRELWLPFGGAGQGDFARLIEVASSRGVRVRERGADSSAETFGDLRLQPLWPLADATSQDRNDASLVLRVEVLDAGETLASVLLPGDLGIAAEAQLLERGTAVAATVLKVGHHGSRGSSSPAWLDAVRPQVAIVSAPCHGQSGLPSAEAMTRLSRGGARVMWTGKHGAVFVGFDTHGGPLVLRGWHRTLACTAHAKKP